EQEAPRTCPGRVSVHLNEGQTDNLFGQFDGIGNGGRRGHKCGLSSVGPCQSPQATQHERNVRAKDAAVRVQLVDHDHTQIGEEVAPATVVRQQAVVEDVRIG